MKPILAGTLAIGLTLGVLGATLAAAQAVKAPRDAPRGFRAIPGVVVGRDWTFLKEDSVRQVFIKHAPRRIGVNPAADLRFEERRNQGSPEDPMLSARSAFEFDCGAKTFRTHQTTFYARQNLKRPYPNVEGQRPPAPWVTPDPDSIASAALAAACRR